MTPDTVNDMTAAAASGGRIVTPIGNANPAGAACTAAPPRTTCVMPIDALRPGIAAPPAWRAAWAAAASTAGLRSLVSATETDSVTIGARTARTDAVAPLEMSGSGGETAASPVPAQRAPTSRTAATTGTDRRMACHRIVMIGGNPVATQPTIARLCGE